MTVFTTIALSAKRYFHALPALAVFIGLLLIASTAHAQNGKKPPKDDPPPSLPDVRYRLERMPIIDQYTDVFQMNDQGLVVGRFIDSGDSFHGFLYDHDGLLNAGVPAPLDADYDPVYRLEDLLVNQLPDGWRLASVEGVNAQGDVVGSLEDTLGNWHGYVVDTSDSSAGAFSDPMAAMSPDPSKWSLQLLPTLNSTYTWGVRINDNGVVLGYYSDPIDGEDDVYVYDPFQPAESPLPLNLDIHTSYPGNYPQLNDQNQVAGVLSDRNAFFYDPDSGLEVINGTGEFVEVNGLNGDGVFSGVVSIQINGKGRTRSVAFRYDDQLEPIITDEIAFDGFLNEDGDVLVATQISSGAHYLSHAGFAPDFSEQVMLVDDLIDENDPLLSEWTDPELWNSLDGLSGRDSNTGYPRLVGTFETSDGSQRGVVLMPYTVSSSPVVAAPEPPSVWLACLSMLAIATWPFGRRTTELPHTSLTMFEQKQNKSSAKSTAYQYTLPAAIGILLSGQFDRSVVGQSLFPNDWIRQGGTTELERATSVAVGLDGATVISGWSGGNLGGPFDYDSTGILAKYDTSGNLLWDLQLTTVGFEWNSSAESVALDSLGNIFVAGDVGGTSGDGFLAKFDTFGDLLWSEKFGTSQNEFSHSLKLDSSGNAFIAGSTWGSLGGTNSGDSDAFLLKFDAKGQILWSRQKGTDAADSANGVTVDAFGNAYVTWTTGISGNGVTGESYLEKYDIQGNLIWSRQVNAGVLTRSLGVAADTTGGIFITGETGSGRGTEFLDAFLAKYDTAGNMVWTKQLGTTGWDAATGVATDDEGNAVITGWTIGNLGGPHAGDWDGFLAKYDTVGNLVGTGQFGTADAEWGYGVAVDSAGHTFVAGLTGGNLGATNAGNTDFFLAKFTLPIPEPATWLLIGCTFTNLLSFRNRHVGTTWRCL